MTNLEQPCDLCDKPHPDTTRLCHKCINHLQTDLKDTPNLLLDVATNGICYDYVDKHSSGYITFTPADVNQISLLDPRSGITRTLNDWARTVRTHLKLTQRPRTPLSELINQHLGWLTWIAKQHWAADYAQDIRHEVHQLRNARDGKPRRIPLGNCPVIDETTKTQCATTLNADPNQTIIRCPKCKTTWHMDTWKLLGKAIS